MRIALVAQEYPPETAKGGIGTQTWLKAHGLAALGHEVHVISRTARGQPAVRAEREDGRVHLVRIPGCESQMGIYTEVADWLTYSAAVAAEIGALHARLPLDLIEFPEWAAEGYVHLLNRSEWSHIPTVVHLHGPLVMFAQVMGWPDMDSEFYRTGTAMEATCVRLADAVFSSSACSADWCATYYGVRRGSIPVLHTGVDTERFAPDSAAKAERPTIVFAGKLVPNKGVVTLVEAACNLIGEFPNLRLHLLGRAEPFLQSQLQTAAERAGAPALLDFAGFVDRSQLPEQLRRAHVFAMPSRYEAGPGLVYLEAMACGLPVVACDAGGVAEVVKHGETGLLVPPGDVAAVAAALRELLADSARREAMGAAARRHVLAEADSRTCIQRIATFYRNVAAGATPRGETSATFAGRGSAKATA